MDSTIDRVALRRDLAAIEAEIRPIKRLLGARWERAMHEEQRRLAWLRARATERCVLLAYARGRLHLRRRGWSSEEAVAWHAALFARLAPDYALAQAPAGSGAGAAASS